MSESLLTGYPAFTAQFLCRRLIETGDQVYLLVRPRYWDDAKLMCIIWLLFRPDRSGRTTQSL